MRRSISWRASTAFASSSFGSTSWLTARDTSEKMRAAAGESRGQRVEGKESKGQRQGGGREEGVRAGAAAGGGSPEKRARRMVRRGLASVHTCWGERQEGTGRLEWLSMQPACRPLLRRATAPAQSFSPSPAPHLDHFKRDVLALPVAVEPEDQPLAGARQLLQVALHLLVLALRELSRERESESSSHAPPAAPASTNKHQQSEAPAPLKSRRDAPWARPCGPPHHIGLAASSSASP